MSEKSNKELTANPAPLGLLGFAMTTILLNIHNAGFYELNAVIMTMGIFYGGIAQLIAGILEFKKGNTFGTVAFSSYGSFWLTLVGIWVFPKLGIMAAPEPVAMVFIYVGIIDFWSILWNFKRGIDREISIWLFNNFIYVTCSSKFYR